MSLAATYSFNGGTVKTIPDGIFTGITALQINVASSTLSTASSTSSSISSSNNHNNMNYYSTTTNRSPMMPSLRIKTNELFYRWFSQPERTEQLKELIHFIKTTNRMPKITELSSFRNVKFNI
jgi:hypothetical protein